MDAKRARHVPSVYDAVSGFVSDGKMNTGKKAMDRLEKSLLLLTFTSPESMARNISWLPRILRQAVARSIASHIAGLLLVSTSSFFTCCIAMLDKGDTLKLIPVEALFWRSLMSWLLTLVAIRASGVKMHVKREFRRALVLRCITGCAVLIITTLVLQKLAVSNATAITYLDPMLTYIFATVLLHEKPGMFAGACSVMCVSGAVLVVRPRFLFGRDGSTDAKWYNRSMTSMVTSYLFGESLAIGCAIFVVLMQTGAHLSLRSLRKVPYLVVVHYFLLATTFAWLAVMLCSHHGKVKVETSFEAWGAISCTGVFAFLEQLFLTRGFHFDAAGVLAATRLLAVGYQFAWSTILLGTGINPYSAGGATAIAVGVIVLVLRRVQMHRAAWS